VSHAELVWTGASRLSLTLNSQVLHASLGALTPTPLGGVALAPARSPGCHFLTQIESQGEELKHLSLIAGGRTKAT
jgi:hypothetical protein